MRDGGWNDVLGLPTSNRDQLCAFCGAARPLFAHRLDPAKVQFRSYGKGYTLPACWTACEVCEELVARPDDQALLHKLRTHHADEDEAHVAALLHTFRASNLGSSPLADHR